MTFLSTKLNDSGSTKAIWSTSLDSTSSTALEKPGVVREDNHPVFGERKFKYVQFHAAASLGDLCTFLDPVTITNITSGTTTSIVTSGLTADLYNGGLLRCTDDAGAAGAAPEGEIGVISDNTTTTITIDSNYGAFSASPAVNDDFQIILPWAVQDAAAGDVAANVAGVAMANQTQYYWGWVQFEGLNPHVNVIVAGTAVTAKKSVIAGTNVVKDGSTSAAELRVGFAVHGVSSDTVARYALVNLCCGPAFKLGASA